MSATASRYIIQKLVERGKLGKEYFIVEYGAGYSTEVFLDQLIKEHVHATYVAVERDPWWYKEVLKMFPGGILAKHQWSFSDYKKFVKANPQNIWEVPESCARLKTTQKKLGSLCGMIRFFLKKNTFWFNSEYRLKIGTVNFECPYICEPFKDQYGESPHKNKYIGIPLEELVNQLKSGKECHAVIMIDGGPRADVVNEIFSLLKTHKNLTVDIFLFEAYRGYYQNVIAVHPEGKFIPAEKNERSDGTLYLQEPSIEEKGSLCMKLMGVTDVNDALKRELWHYTNA